jgi:protoporphyrinogen oxidase
MAKFVILGAGMTGLNSAYFLNKDYFLAEKKNKVGGLAGSIEKNGYLFDYAEHFLRLPNKDIENFLKKLMGDKLFFQKLRSAIYFKNKYIPYPFQNNIRELPLNELKKCAKSLIENYFSREKNKSDFANFEEYIYYVYGDYIAQEFMIPYNEKIWAIKPSKMIANWFFNPELLKSLNLDQILTNILPFPKNVSKTEYIRWYSIKGGSQEIANSYLPYLNHLALNMEAIKISIEEKLVTFKNGHSESYTFLISTIPLPELLKLIPKLPPEIEKLIPELKFNSVYCLNICLDRENINKNHWLYFPQKNIPFSRLFFSSNFSKFNAPKGKGSCSALATYLQNSKFNFNEFKKDTFQKLIELGFLKDDSEVVDIIPLNIKYGFTLPTIGLKESLDIIKDYLIRNSIYSIGRYGEWKYAGIEHAIEDGKKIAKILS